MPSIRLCAALLALTPTAATQVLTLDPGPHAPGTVVPVLIDNDTQSDFFFPDGCGLSVVADGTGELQGTVFVPAYFCDAIYLVPPGGSQTQDVVAPSEPGSYVVVFLGGGRAVAPFSVVAPDSPTATVHAYPSALEQPQVTHHVDFADPAATPFDLANTGSVPHLFSAGERLIVRAPGEFAVLASLDLGGTVVPAGGVTQIALPLEGLAPGPYEIEIDWTDPGTGGTVVARHGVHVSGSRLDLHLPSGHTLAVGAPVRASVGTQGFPGTSGMEPFCLVVVGFLPGTTVLPDGTVASVVQDGLVDLSLSGLGGQLLGAAQVIPNGFGPASFFGHGGSMTGVELHHPGVPGLTGLSVRLAAVAFDPPQVEWGASQPETIVFE